MSLQQPSPEVSVRHSVALAVKVNPTVLACHQHYGDEKVPFEFKRVDEIYCFNRVDVPISMRKVHGKMYPEVYDALQNAENLSDKGNSFIIIFNGPHKDWVKPPKPNPNDGRVRVRIESQDLLKRLYEACGSYLDIQINGHVQSELFARGRMKDYPLGKDGTLALRVKSDGTTSEETIRMPPGLFGKYYEELKTVISITLSWFGPELVFGYLPGCAALRKESKMDIKLTVDGGAKTYKCHSKLLEDHSPVFAAMLRNDMLEQQKKEIKIDDFDCETVEAFLRFIYTGNIMKPYNDCHLCFELLYFSHKYNISELEEITRDIFFVHPKDWILPSVALDLYFFSSSLSEYDNMRKRAKSVLRIRQKELLEEDKFKDFLANFPNFLKQLELK